MSINSKVSVLVLTVAASASLAAGVWFVRGSSANPEYPPLDEQRASAFTAAASEEQRPAFADNVISRDEYEAAVNRTVSCMRSAGVTVEGPSWEGTALRLVYSAPSRAEMDKARETYADCFARYSREIEEAWDGTPGGYQTPTAAQRKTVSDVLIQCARESGIDLPAAASFGDLARALNARASAGISSGGILEKCNAVAAAAAGLPTP
jgi:hypothetical protein